jgi:hypothetical protein
MIVRQTYLFFWVGSSIIIHIDGEPWVEPAQYWERIAYPAYIRAHSHLFHKGNVESGDANQKTKNLRLLVLDGEGTEKNLATDAFFRIAAGAVLAESRPRKQSLLGILRARF